MINRFFKLLYILSLIAIAIYLPASILNDFDYDAVVRASYSPKCYSNNQFIVLQGSQYGEVSVVDEFFLNGENSTALKKQFNFYCQYYDEIQPHITAYLESKTLAEQKEANINFFNFKESMDDNVTIYPLLYNLEVVSEVTQWNHVYNPIIEGLLKTLFWFLLLQSIRMSYLYVVFGKIVWHPFRKT